MGGERWIEFQPGEMKKVKAYLKDVYATSVIDEQISASVSIGWHDSKLEISYNTGSPWPRELADFVASELAKRFKVKKIGADSTGWYKDSDWKSNEVGAPKQSYGPFASWADWAKAYKPEWSYLYQFDESDLMLALLRTMAIHTQSQFIELDQLRGLR